MQTHKLRDNWEFQLAEINKRKIDSHAKPQSKVYKLLLKEKEYNLPPESSKHQS